MEGSYRSQELVDFETMEQERPKRIFIQDFPVRITVTSSAQEIEAFIDEICVEPNLALGIDVQWNRNKPVLTPATLQLSTGSKCIIIQLIHLKTIPPCLCNFLNNPNISFIGFGISDPLKNLEEIYGLRIKYVDLRQENCRGCDGNNQDGEIDLDDNDITLAVIARKLMLRHIEKSVEVAVSNWETLLLLPEQIIYAATDAAACYRIWYEMSHRNYFHCYWVCPQCVDLRSDKK